MIFEESDVAFYVACISSALEFIHSRNILHRDVKPENIILDSRGYPHLTGNLNCTNSSPSLYSSSSVHRPLIRILLSPFLLPLIFASASSVLLFLYSVFRFWCSVRSACRYRGRTYVSTGQWHQAISSTRSVLQTVSVITVCVCVSSVYRFHHIEVCLRCAAAGRVERREAVTPIILTCICSLRNSYLLT